MNRKQIWIMVGKWSLVTTVPILLFWFAILLAKGNTPVATIPGISSYIPLRFEEGMHEVPRDWDALAGLIWPTLIIWGYWKWKIKASLGKKFAENTADEWFKMVTWLLAFFAFVVAVLIGIVWGLVVLILSTICFALIFLTIPTAKKIFKWAMEIPEKETE